MARAKIEMKMSKVLTFKISNFFEEKGMLDIVEGKTATEDEVMEAKVTRETNDEAYGRNQNEALDDFFDCFTNVAPYTPMNSMQAAHTASIIWEILNATPMHCSDLEKRLETTRLYNYSTGKGHSTKIRELIKYLIDRDFLFVDSSLRLSVSITDEKQANLVLQNIHKELEKMGFGE